jgi:hypothetical protein
LFSVQQLKTISLTNWRISEPQKLEGPSPRHMLLLRRASDASTQQTLELW